MYELEQSLLTVRAAEDLSPTSSIYKAVSLNGLICTAALIRQCAGILKHGGKANEGVSVVRKGITKAYAGAAINTVGFGVTLATNSGFLIAASSGGISFGRALETCNSGDLFPVAVDFDAIVMWPG